MSKISKIQSIKQERRYRNQTMNVLNYHLGNKLGAPSLADKSFNAIKNVRPEIQSSRLYRPQTGKLSTKSGLSFYVGYSQDKDKNTQPKQRYQNISSKSLQSRNSANKSYRKQNDKTKKNSYSKLQIQIEKQQNNKNAEAFDDNFQKRIKIIESIFTTRKEVLHKCEQILILQQPSVIQLKKNFSNIELPQGYINMRYTSNNGNSQYSSTNKGKKISNQCLSELGWKFKLFNDCLQQRKTKMVFDELDLSLQNIFNQIYGLFLGIIDTLLLQNEQKLRQIESGIQKMVADHDYEIKKCGQKLSRIKHHYKTHIQTMLVRSLYVTDKINMLQQKGTIHFQKEVRDIDEQSTDRKTFDEALVERNSELPAKAQTKNHQYLQQTEDYQYQNYQSQYNQSYEYLQQFEGLKFDYINHKPLKSGRDKIKLQNKYNSQSQNNKIIR